MTKRHKNILQVHAKNPPVVELDSAAHAAYVRFSNEKVVRTVVIDVNRCLVTADLAQNGDVIGVELVGVGEFGIEKLLEKAGIRGVSDGMLQSTRYVAANVEPVAC
jgi:uncharacterized protein YuzE